MSAPVSPPTYVILSSDGTSTKIAIPPVSVTNPVATIGPLMQVVITDAGTGYSAGFHSVTFTGGTGIPSATGTIFVTGTVVTGVAITSNGGTTTPYTISDTLTDSVGNFKCSVTSLPVSTTVNEMSGVNSLNWGANILKSVLHLTENFAGPTAPGSNPVLGGVNVTPLKGQMWYNTTTNTMHFYNGTDFNTSFSTGGISAVTASAPITATTTGGIANIVLPNTAVTPGVYSYASITVDASGRITAASSGAAPSGGTITAVNSSSASLTSSTSGSVVTLALNGNLNSLGNGIAQGLIRSNGASSGYATALASDITGLLGYTPYNSTNPAGYISGNQTITLTGDVTGSGTTSISVSLAAITTATTVGSTTLVPQITVDTKGRITSATNVTPALFSASTPGNVPASGGGTANFMRADGTWAAPGVVSSTVATNGKIVYAGGLIDAWGSITTGTLSGETTYGPYTFPAGTFPNNCFSIQLTGNGGAPLGATSLSKTGFSIITGYTGGAATTVVYYRATGN